MNDELFDYFPVEADSEEQKIDILSKAVSLVVTEPIMEVTKIAFSNPTALLAVKWNHNAHSSVYRSISPLVDPDLAGDLGPIYEQDSDQYLTSKTEIDPNRNWGLLDNQEISVIAQDWWFRCVDMILKRAVPPAFLERTAVKSCTIPIIGVHNPTGLYTKRAIEVPTFDLIGE